MRLNHNNMEADEMNLTKDKVAVGRLLLLFAAVVLLFGSDPVAIEASTMIHNSTTLGSSKWAGDGGWGVENGKYGEFTCATCHERGSGNIKRVRKLIAAPNGIDSFPIEGAISPDNEVTFTSTVDGSSDFGDDGPGGHATSTKICEACHTLNKYHNYNTANNTDGFAHENQKDCMTCHVHSLGFKASCNTCHGNPPVTNDLAAGTGLVYDPAATGGTDTTGSETPSAGAHMVHATTESMACITCHKGNTMPSVSYTIQMGFDVNNTNWPGFGAAVAGGSLDVPQAANMTNGFTYASGDGGTTVVFEQNIDNPTCAVYCHGNWPGNGGQTVTLWTGGAAITNDCNDCHGGSSATPPTAGNHQLHAGAGAGDLALACSTCHPTYGAGDATHIDGDVAYDMSNIALGTTKTYRGNTGYNSTGLMAPSGAYGSCVNYCHGAEMPKGDTSGVTDTGVVWGASNSSGCGFCHGMPPTAGTTAATHSGKTNLDCQGCHPSTVTDTNNPPTLNPTFHRNGTLEASVDSCSACHSSLSNDHSDHVDYAYFLAGKTVSAGDYGKVLGSGTNNYGWYEIDYLGTGQPVIGCGQCHPDSDPGHPGASGLQVDLDGTDDTASAGDQGPKALNSSPTYTSNKCSNVYCHSNGVAGALVFDATPPTWGTDTITCNGCHGNSPTSNAHSLHEVGIHYETLLDDDLVGLMAAGYNATLLTASGGTDAAHGNSNSSSTLTCITCHKNSVADSANAGNTTCSICHIDNDTISTGNELARNAWQHLNGQVDVSFAALSTFKSKAQLRNDITAVAEVDASWARYNAASLDNTAYKLANSYDLAKNAVPLYNSADMTCATVDCHNGIKTPTWDSNSDNCMSCHTELPQ